MPMCHKMFVFLNNVQYKVYRTRTKLLKIVVTEIINLFDVMK